MAKDLLTKHGKYYELNPYKVIMRLEDIRDLDQDEYRLDTEIDDLIEQIYEELDLPR